MKSASCFFAVFAVVVLSPILATLAAAEPDKEQAALVARIKSLGGGVTFDEEAADRPIVEVLLTGRGLDNESLARLVPDLKRLPKLRKLLVFSPAVTDEGLRPLADLANIKELRLNCQLTGSGIALLASLMNLESLDFVCSPELTDEGLASLKHFPQLRRLSLIAAANVTDAGLANVAGLTNLTELTLSHMAVTDAGLVHLQGLTSLKTLRLSPQPRMAYSAAALRDLQLALPNCKIIR